MCDDRRLDLRSMNIPNDLMHLFKSKMKSLYSQFWFCILKAVNRITWEKWVSWIPSVMFSTYCWRLVVTVGPLPYSWWKESPSWVGWWEPIYSRECGDMVWRDDGVAISSRRNWRCRNTPSSLWETGKKRKWDWEIALGESESTLHFGWCVAISEVCDPWNSRVLCVCQ